MSARPVIWQYGKRGKGRKALAKTRRIPITSMWRNEKNAHSRKDATKKGPKAKPTRLVLNREHTEQMAFQESEYFKIKAKDRYEIEAKNSELKHRHGYDVASSSGLIGMELQEP